MTYDDLLLTAGGVALILADLRARALANGNDELPSLYETTFGMNMSSIKTEGERIYTDLAQVREWRENGPPYGYPQAGGEYLTEDNEVRVTPAAGLLMFFARPNAEGPVVCEAMWTGSGSMTFQAGQGNTGGTTVTNQAPVTADGVTRRRFTVTHEWDDQTDLAAVVVSTDPANPIRFTIREVSNTSTGLFDPDFIARSAIYNGPKRLMDWTSTNNNLDPGPFANRRKPSFKGYSGDGISIEHIIAFANACYAVNPKSNKIWVCLPAYCSLDYASRYANALDTGAGTTNGIALHPNIVVYLELGNEWFNRNFRIFNFALDRGVDRGAVTPQERQEGNIYALIREHVYRHNLIMGGLEGNVDLRRFVRVLGHQNTTSMPDDYIKNGAAHFEAATSAFYFGIDINNPPAGGYSYTENLDVLFQRHAVSFDSADADNRQIKAYWTSLNVPWIVYEGQSHYVQGDNQQSGYFNQPLFTAFHQDPRMFGDMDKLFTTWANDYGGAFVGYYAIGTPDARYGAWGFRRSQNAALAISPKHRAMLKALGLPYAA